MTRAIHRLTPLKVDRAKLAAGQRTRMLADGGGLYLQIQRNGTPPNETEGRSWIFRYSTGQKTVSKTGKERKVERWHGIGPLHTVGLADARTKAAELRLMLRDGKDPIVEAERADAKGALDRARVMTFEMAAAALIATREVEWKNAKHSLQWGSTLKEHAYKIIGKVGVGDIDTALVMKVLSPIWHEIPETASRVRGRIEAVLDWAKVAGHRTGDNPARWRGHLEVLLPKRSKVRPVEHFAALAYDEIGDFLAELRGRPATSARALEFLILTASRTNEVAGCSWDQIDVKEWVWTIKAPKMKGARDHRVPIVGRAREILMEIDPKDRHGIVFPGPRGGSMSNMAMLMLLDRMKLSVTVHGFRATFKTWATEQTNYQRETVEAALAHAAGDALEAAYQRGDLFEKRRRLMIEWDKYCSTQSVKIYGNVLTLTKPERA